MASLRMFWRPLTSVIDALGEDESDPYWCRRLLEEPIPPSEAEKLRPRLVRALATWASHDPLWFVRGDSFGSFRYGPVFWHWLEDMFDEFERIVAIPDASLRHLVLATICWNAFSRAGIGAGRPERTARHMLKVEKRHKSPAYARNLVMVLAATEPARVLGMVKMLTACPEAREIARAWPALLENDVRLAKWDAYDGRRKVYRALQRAGVTTKRDDRRVTELDRVRKARRQE